MEVLVYLVPLALGLGALGLAAFLWSLQSGQFDDLEGPAHRILDDDDTNVAPSALPDTDAHIALQQDPLTSVKLGGETHL